MLSDCTNVNKQHSRAPKFTSLEIFGLYSTNWIRSVVTVKETEKCKYFFITINLSYLQFSRL